VPDLFIQSRIHFLADEHGSLLGVASIFEWRGGSPG
jgi:hypothetical protein